MENLLTYLVEQITGEPPQAITSNEQDGVTVYTVTVSKEHMALLIGKGGRTISSIRTLARIKAAKEQKRIAVELQEQANE